MHTDSPYQASQVVVAPDHEQLRANQLPHAIGGPVKHLWVLARVLCALALLASIAAVATQWGNFRDGTLSLLMLLLSAGGILVDAVVFAGLSWGIRRYSRAAACAMLGYYLLGQLLFVFQNQSFVLVRLAIVIVVSLICVRGIRATFAYHRHAAAEKGRPPRARLSDDPAFAPKIDTAP
ncbi:hypothetical protein [Stenotrophomonas sp.]|uniref:hypothetical protein n=1 Tax=Stenotrophomonas sp. TaxID=69392 RepID=UPI0028AFD67E|nr:hypothetical protein [Stenotrophomonas sp.]